jgi:hypothetical protein
MAGELLHTNRPGQERLAQTAGKLAHIPFIAEHAQEAELP